MKPLTIKSQTCPVCGEGGDRLGNPLEKEQPEHQPQAGDATICFYCSALLILDVKGSELILREMTEEEILNLPVEQLQEIATLQTRLTAYRKQLKEKLAFLKELNVQVVPDEIAEQVDYVMCGSQAFLPNAIQTCCALCGSTIFHSPNAPKKPKKICMECGLKVGKSDPEAAE